jgi:hypothetical protein
LLQRLARRDSKADEVKVRVSRLLDEKAKIPPDQQPIINSYYRDNFAVVDDFNKCLARARWPYQHHGEQLFYVISCLRVLSVNIINLYLDLRGVEERPKVKKHVSLLADSLLAVK